MANSVNEHKVQNEIQEQQKIVSLLRPIKAFEQLSLRRHENRKCHISLRYVSCNI